MVVASALVVVVVIAEIKVVVVAAVVVVVVAAVALAVVDGSQCAHMAARSQIYLRLFVNSPFAMPRGCYIESEALTMSIKGSR